MYIEIFYPQASFVVLMVITGAFVILRIFVW